MPSPGAVCRCSRPPTASIRASIPTSPPRVTTSGSSVRHLPRRRGVGRQPVEGVAQQRQRVLVGDGEVVGDPGDARVHVAAAELLGRDDLAGRGLHQRRPTEEDRALSAHDHRLVGHRRDVGAAGRARSHHRRQLGDPGCRHRGLVVEDAPEVLAVGEDLVLQREERAAGVDKVDARQVVVERDLLGAQVLLDRHRVVGAALDGGVVGDHDAFLSHHLPDAGDDAAGRHLLAVEPERGKW